MEKPNQITITLDYPIQLADKVITEITIRRPVMGDMRKHPIKGVGDGEGEMKLLGALCKLKLEEMDLLDTSDYEKLQDAFSRFRSSTSTRNDT